MLVRSIDSSPHATSLFFPTLSGVDALGNVLVIDRKHGPFVISNLGKSGRLVGDDVKAYHVIENGDVVAFSGAVPYSYGYGAPVV